MKEMVIISGKGGTGKTSIVASFAALAEKAVLADCDVDAADLHLVLEPKILLQENFSGGKRAAILPEKCTACGKCIEVCRFSAIQADGPTNSNGDTTSRINPIACEGCGVCKWFCPSDAINFKPVVNGEWYSSECRFGPMIHARLGVAEENSGKLVSVVRTQAKKIAKQTNADLIIVDGSPGIGCTVVASITGADVALIVTEPTLSGLHDLGRVAEVAKHFGIPTLVCINKWDINPELTKCIEEDAKKRELPIVGRVRYDHAVTEAQLFKRTVVEHATNGCSEDIRSIWKNISAILHTQGERTS